MKRTSSLVFLLPFAILAALAFPAMPADAGVGVWTSLGPDGAHVSALAVDPLDPDVVYAGTQRSGIFRSTDSGETWAFAGRSLTHSFISVIAGDPVHPGTVYAAVSPVGLFKSTDGGGTWVRIWNGALPENPGDFTSIYTLALDPRRPDTVYAGTDKGLYRSTDGGATWQRRGGLSGRLVALALDSPGGWLFSSVGGLGVFKSGDQGTTWTAVSNGLPPNPSVNSLAIDPDHPRTLLAATQTGIYRTLDRGRTWHRAAGSPTRQVLVVAFQRRGRAYATFRQGGIFRSADSGATWQLARNGSPDSLFQALAAGPSAVYTGDMNDAERSGLLRSLDGGASWKPSMHGLSGLGIRPVAVDPSNPRILYVGGDSVYASRGSIFKSTDRGTTWTRFELGLQGVFDILIDPARPSRVYATAYPGPLLRSDDGGATWERLNGAVVPEALTDLAVDPRAPEALWGTGTDDLGHGLFHSADGGETWERIEGLPVDPDFFALHVEVDPRDPRVVYLGAAQNVDDPLQSDPRLFRSTDGGETWERRDAGLAAGAVFDVALDPADPATLYAMTSGVCRSTDAAASWRLLPARGAFFVSLATAPAAPGAPAALYAARWDIYSPAAVMRSTDRGETWTALRKGLDSYTPVVLEVDPTDPRRLYLSTDERGLMSWTLD